MPYAQYKPYNQGDTHLKKSRALSGRGFTLIEVIVGATLFAILSVAVYQSYAGLTNLVSLSRSKIIATDVVNEQMEIIRNLPYENVGIVGGIPAGVIPREQEVEKENIRFIVTTTIRNIDDPFDGTIGGTPNDLSPADYKSVDIRVDCPTCSNFSPVTITGRVSPRGLETASNNGALFVRIFDANGIPVPQATVRIVNTEVSPAITIQETTNDDGILQIVDAPPSNNAYQITVTKTGYSTDETLAPSQSNPNPLKPHATVVVQQVTQTSFVIDEVSDITFRTVTPLCAIAPSVPFVLEGTKLIGASPSVYKYTATHTSDATGSITVPDIEWDTYSVRVLGDVHDLVGVNPPLPFQVLPGANQNIEVIVESQNSPTLLVGVKDSNSNLPLSEATVSLVGAGDDELKVTGRGSIRQTDWSLGSGQDTVGDSARYFTSDGNIETQNFPGELRLSNIFGFYAASGNLTSSTFDTGTSSNFHQLNWQPTAQPVETGTPNVRFRIATNNDNETWEYRGPDGTTGGFYDTTNTNIHSSHNGDRYVRYRVFLDTASTTFSPNIADVAFTFTSDCLPPGQVAFSGLTNGTYTLQVVRDGYNTYETQIQITDDWQYHEVGLSPL